MQLNSARLRAHNEAWDWKTPTSTQDYAQRAERWFGLQPAPAFGGGQADCCATHLLDGSGYSSATMMAGQLLGRLRGEGFVVARRRSRLWRLCHPLSDATDAAGEGAVKGYPERLLRAVPCDEGFALQMERLSPWWRRWQRLLLRPAGLGVHAKGADGGGGSGSGSGGRHSRASSKWCYPIRAITHLTSQEEPQGGGGSLSPAAEAVPWVEISFEAVRWGHTRLVKMRFRPVSMADFEELRAGLPALIEQVPGFQAKTRSFKNDLDDMY